MENIFDLKLKSLGRKTAHTGNPKKKDTENCLKTKANSLLKFWQFGQKQILKSKSYKTVIFLTKAYGKTH